MTSWAKHFVDCLKKNGIKLITYVPDKPIAKVVTVAEEDPELVAICATREEEGVGIVTGGFLGGMRGALLMQTGGIGNSLNALTSLAIPQQLPFLLVVTQRGELGEFNLSQVPLGRSLRAIFDAVGIQHFTLHDTDEKEMAWTIQGAVKLAYASRVPVAIILAQGFEGKLEWQA